MWTIETRKYYVPTYTSRGELSAVKFSPFGHYFACGTLHPSTWVGRHTKQQWIRSPMAKKDKSRRTNHDSSAGFCKESGACILLVGHDYQIRCLEFSPATKLLASADYRDRIKMWNIERQVCAHWWVKNPPFINFFFWLYRAVHLQTWRKINGSIIHRRSDVVCHPATAAFSPCA